MKTVLVFKLLNKTETYSFRDLNGLVRFILNKDTSYARVNKIRI